MKHRSQICAAPREAAMFRRSRRVFLLLLLPAALLSVAAAPFLGAGQILPWDVFDSASSEYVIFWRLRLPRVLGAFFSGAALALSGLVFQALFRNPLATPFTLGVSSGAALGASLYFRLGAAATLAGLAGSLIFSLGGCLLSMLLVWGITRARGGFSTAVLLLAGVIINFFFSSIVMFIQYWSNANDALQILRWLMGSVAGIEPARLVELALAAGVGFPLVLRLAPELDLLTAGEELALSRGVDVRGVTLRLFVIASLVVGVVVSVSGPIGFVGMMAPQICRFRLGFRHGELVPASMLLGGSFLVWCDFLARTILFPAEVPIGIITAMFGAPFFLWTLFSGSREGWLE